LFKLIKVLCLSVSEEPASEFFSGVSRSLTCILRTQTYSNYTGDYIFGIRDHNLPCNRSM